MKKTTAILGVKERFLELYRSGEFAKGSKLPSETIMAQRFGVSRETWRGALELLRRDGILVSRHGSGTYLLNTPARISSDLSQLQSLTSMLAAAGIEESTSVSEIRHAAAPKEVCEFFEVEEGTVFCIIERIRRSPDRAVSISRNYLPAAYMEGITDETLPASLFHHLEHNYHIYIRRAFTEIVVPPYSDPMRQKLEPSPEVPVLGLKQAHYDSKGYPALFSIDYFPGDVFHFTVTRIRE